MNRTATSTLVFAGILTMIISVAAFGQVGTEVPQEDKKVDIELEPTRLGEQLGFWGFAVKKLDNGIEIFGTRVLADMADRTLVEVVIATREAEHSVGVIEMFLGSGKLELWSSRDPSEAFPLSRVREVLVTYRGQVILRGQFPG